MSRLSSVEIGCDSALSAEYSARVRDSTNPSPSGSDNLAEVAGGFPRHLTQELLDEDAQKGERRKWIAPWFIGAAFALFALAAPTERVLGTFPLKADADEGFWWFLLERIGGEPAGFILSAVCIGLFIPTMTHALAATGLSRGVSLTATLCVALSPLLVHAATLPGPEALVALGSVLAFWLAAPHGVGRARTSVAIALGVGISVFELGGLLILPALLLRHFSRGSLHRPSGRSLWYGTAWAVAGVVAAGLLESVLLPEEHMSQDPSLLRYAIFPGALGLGLAFLITPNLLLRRPEALAEDAPLWLRLWLLGGVSSLLLSGASGLCLTPIAAFVIADTLSRRGPTPQAVGGLLIASQLLLSLFAVRYVRSNDPDAAWQIQLRGLAERGDRLISEVPTHRYFARARCDIQASPPGGPTAKILGPHLVDLGDEPPFLRFVGERPKD